MLFDECSDQCGWIAALIASIAYGSYGVPVKEAFRRRTTVVTTTTVPTTMKIKGKQQQKKLKKKSITNNADGIFIVAETNNSYTYNKNDNDNNNNNDSDNNDDNDNDGTYNDFVNDDEDDDNQNIDNTTSTSSTFVEVNPFVFQTYKTVVMFVLCLLVPTITGIEIKFSKWGYLSGLLWVCGGTFGVVAVKYAGMALAVGTWASIMIGINFIWGIIIFNEPINNIYSTIGAFTILTIGLIGMSYYASLPPVQAQVQQQQQQLAVAATSTASSTTTTVATAPVSNTRKKIVASSWSSQSKNLVRRTCSNDVILRNMSMSTSNNSNNNNISNSTVEMVRTNSSATTNEFLYDDRAVQQQQQQYEDEHETETNSNNNNNDYYDYDDNNDDYNDDDDNNDTTKLLLLSTTTRKSHLVPDNGTVSENSRIDDDDCIPITIPIILVQLFKNITNNRIVFCLTIWFQRCIRQSKPTVTTTTTSNSSNSIIKNRIIYIRKPIVGMVAAIANGCLGGSSLIPMHFAKKDGFFGANYFISYSVGALVCNILMWILLFLYNYIYFYYYSSSGNYKNKTTMNGTVTTTITKKKKDDLYCVNNQADDETTTTSIADSRTDNDDYSVTVTTTSIQQHQQLQQHQHNTTTSTTITAYEKAINNMPSLQLRTLWLPGIIAGLFLSIAMFGAIVSVGFLGQGVGNSVIQSKILISGMWGIFWYREINQPRAVLMWFVSASLTVLGIIWLSHERIAATSSSNVTTTDPISIDDTNTRYF